MLLLQENGNSIEFYGFCHLIEISVLRTLEVSITNHLNMPNFRPPFSLRRFVPSLSHRIAELI